MAALARVLGIRAEMARCEATRSDAPPEIHKLRKRTKELRGLLRLLRPGTSGARALDRSLRDAARAIAEMRDLEVMAMQFDAITARLRDPNRFAGLRCQIFDEYTNRTDSLKTEPLRQYLSCIQSFEREFEELAPEKITSSRFWGSISSTYRAAQALQAEARESLDGSFDATPFHELRKHVKRHWYQARFLRKIRPKKMDPHIRRIDDLGELLGAHNDLDVLMVFLDSRDTLAPEDITAREIFRAHIIAQRRILATKALKRADKALARSPEKLVSTWQRWWRDWRDD